MSEDRFTEETHISWGERIKTSFKQAAGLGHERARKLLSSLRARAKITSHFCISASAHLWLIPHSHLVLLNWPRNSSLFLWFCSLGSAKPEPNLSANSAKLFLREPLTPSGR